ncbi:hypothetical protein IF1G_01765 [Cordyceps javanica]|uniref:Uncharacterized protein n=1 Tax=Cordyceps javanica TaxID=43265 RepID=A0A545VCW0_9HYPO|nr:hypothetical protein IF1G_01765 [Cordyceps javanica]
MEKGGEMPVDPSCCFRLTVGQCQSSLSVWRARYDGGEVKRGRASRGDKNFGKWSRVCMIFVAGRAVSHWSSGRIRPVAMTRPSRKSKLEEGQTGSVDCSNEGGCTRQRTTMPDVVAEPAKCGMTCVVLAAHNAVALLLGTGLIA